jgi:hypothetical protein
MTGAWSSCPVGTIVELTDLEPLGQTLGQHNGESRRVCRLREHPEWVFKEYQAPVLAAHEERLTRLIGLPAQMTATQKALVDRHTSWPTTCVVDGRDKTIGVLMPLAPPKYSSTRQMPGGRKEVRLLEVDVLALTEDQQAHFRLPRQSLPDRISVCACIASVGALFERQGLVYLDWSYANVFWSLTDHSAYVIDLDGCSFGARPQIETPNWADPLVPRGTDAGNETDRFRVALLIARCITGKRTSMSDTRSGLFGLRNQGGDVSQTRASYLVWAALGLSRLLPIVLMLAMTAEWSQRTAMTTFTMEPHRGRILTAKVLAGLGIGAVSGCFAFLAAEVTVVAARAAGHHVALAWDWPQLAGFALFVLLTSFIGIAMGSALHNTAAAIVTYFALAAAFSLLMIPALQHAGEWVNTGQTFGWMLSGQWSGHGAQIATSAALWTALPLAIGAVRTIRRDVH